MICPFHQYIKTGVLHFKVKNTTLKEKNGKRKFKRIVSFLFEEEGKLSIKKSSFEEFNLVFFTAECMVCFEMQPRQQSFCWIFRYILYSMAKEITFLGEDLCFFKFFIVPLYIFSSALKKNYKMHAPRFEMDFVLNFKFTFVTGSTTQIVLRELL